VGARSSTAPMLGGIVGIFDTFDFALTGLVCGEAGGEIGATTPGGVKEGVFDRLGAGTGAGASSGITRARPRVAA
jgi:hypothetical protein